MTSPTDHPPAADLPWPGEAFGRASSALSKATSKALLDGWSVSEYVLPASLLPASERSDVATVWGRPTTFEEMLDGRCARMRLVRGLERSAWLVAIDGSGETWTPEELDVLHEMIGLGPEWRASPERAAISCSCHVREQGCTCPHAARCGVESPPLRFGAPADAVPLHEDVSTHAMHLGFEGHPDGRLCSWHGRHEAWVFQHEGAWWRCRRDDHPDLSTWRYGAPRLTHIDELDGPLPIGDWSGMCKFVYAAHKSACAAPDAEERPPARALAARAPVVPKAAAYDWSRVLVDYVTGVTDELDFGGEVIPGRLRELLERAAPPARYVEGATPRDRFNGVLRELGVMSGSLHELRRELVEVVDPLLEDR